MLNAASATDACPSLTVMPMSAKVPTLLPCGMPCNWPVVAENVAQTGLLRMVNVSVSPSASAAVGVNEYVAPTTMVVGGVPEIVGARFGGGVPAVTVRSNAGNGV